MPKETHTKAAEHHDNAAKAHRAAAEHHGKGEHDKGNEENVFDRLDYKLSNNDTLQLNLEFTRSWFQTPNTWDQQLQTCTVLSADCSGSGIACCWFAVVMNMTSDRS